LRESDRDKDNDSIDAVARGGDFTLI